MLFGQCTAQKYDLDLVARNASHLWRIMEFEVRIAWALRFGWAPKILGMCHCHPSTGRQGVKATELTSLPDVNIERSPSRPQKTTSAYIFFLSFLSIHCNRGTNINREHKNSDEFLKIRTVHLAWPILWFQFHNILNISQGRLGNLITRYNSAPLLLKEQPKLLRMRHAYRKPRCGSDS